MPHVADQAEEGRQARRAAEGQGGQEHRHEVPGLGKGLHGVPEDVGDQQVSQRGDRAGQDQQRHAPEDRAAPRAEPARNRHRGRRKRRQMYAVTKLPASDFHHSWVSGS
jgi:hypothetical protein